MVVPPRLDNPWPIAWTQQPSIKQSLPPYPASQQWTEEEQKLNSNIPTRTMSAVIHSAQPPTLLLWPAQILERNRCRQAPWYMPQYNTKYEPNIDLEKYLLDYHLQPCWKPGIPVPHGSLTIYTHFCILTSQKLLRSGILPNQLFDDFLIVLILLNKRIVLFQWMLKVCDGVQ
jgi:hypothetical protein